MHPLPPPRRHESVAANNSTEARDHQSSEASRGPTSGPENSSSHRPSQPSALTVTGQNMGEGKKKRKHRGGKRKKNRRQSFAAPSETSTMLGGPMMEGPLIEVDEDAGPRGSIFYGRRGNGNMSDDSLDSEALLDHRDQPMMRPRRESRVQASFGTSHRSGIFNSGAPSFRQDTGSTYTRRPGFQRQNSKILAGDGSDEGEDAHDRTPLISSSSVQRSPVEGYGLLKKISRERRGSASTHSSRTKRRAPKREQSFPSYDQEYDVNNPPSMPPSPQTHGDNGVDDVMVPGGEFLTRSPDSRRNLVSANRDTLIDIDCQESGDLISNSAPPSPRFKPEMQRRKTINLPTDDVCLPPDAMSELGDEDFDHEHFEQHPHGHTGGPRRRGRGRGFPKLWVLDEWSREEKEERMEGMRAKKVSEPVLVEGRLRPKGGGWHRRPEDLPYRFTYFNEEFESTIHAQTISELVQPGGSFRDLFIPEPPELSDSSSEEEDEKPLEMNRKGDAASLLSPRSQFGEDGGPASRFNSMLSGPQQSSRENSGPGSKQPSGTATPKEKETPPEEKGTPLPQIPRPKKYGRRPSFWLDVMCPTNQEMQILCKTFGIHALTAEDIMMQEAREKVELFRHYYFINYRTFEQDTNSEDYLEPLNMYVIVFPAGVLSFHFSQIPHPANVRRRIRQLTDYLELSADWIAYGIIDDITDVYQPLIHAIESEVDDIDESILGLFQETVELASAANSINNEKTGDDASSASSKEKQSGFDLLRRIGECRKKVMSLYRLLGNKADVIKGFAKRCNEQWEVAPKSEIGLYLGDIQDHILTMTSNLSHYETLLARAHSNYLAQINIRMNERQEKTADVLGKLTVVGTIVLPMNIICGMWGMNVKVPGQEIDNLYWFWSITAGLAVFALVCFYWCKKVYGIV